jgi:hypothetical protein
MLMKICPAGNRQLPLFFNLHYPEGKAELPHSPLFWNLGLASQDQKMSGNFWLPLTFAAPGDR